MTTSTASTRSEPFYKGTQDWVDWKGAFRIKAERLELWCFIDPASNLPWPTAPRLPIPQDFPPRNINGVLRPPQSRSELQAQQLTKFKADLEDWGISERIWDRQLKRINQLGDWIQNTVDTRVFNAQIGAGRNLREQYLALVNANVGQDVHRVLHARTQYKKHLNEISKWGKKLNEWTTEWELLMREGIREGVAECGSPQTWFSDLTMALQEHESLLSWVATITVTKGPQINSGLITFEQMANELQTWIATLNTKEGKKNWKAGFHTQEGSPASLHGKEAPALPSRRKRARANTAESTDEPEDSANERTERQSKERFPKRGRGRGRGHGRGHRVTRSGKDQSERSGSEGKDGKKVHWNTPCPACNKEHLLEDCWIAFPDNAPDYYRENKAAASLLRTRRTNDSKFDKAMKEAEEIIRSRKK